MLSGDVVPKAHAANQRNACSSVVADISEVAQKRSDGDHARFFQFPKGKLDRNGPLSSHSPLAPEMLYFDSNDWPQMDDCNCELAVLHKRGQQAGRTGRPAPGQPSDYLPWRLLMTRLARTNLNVVLVLSVATVPLLGWACTSHPLGQPLPDPVQQTNLYVDVSPVRQLDMVFMIDNSPSMAPKQAKLQAQFPKLIDALRDPNTNALPDLRIAIIDSDLGTAGAWASGSCGPNAENGNSPWGDKGQFRMINAQSCGVLDQHAMWLEYAGGKSVNFTGDISQVFGCLASQLGTMGCGEEHQLEAFQFALMAKGIGNDTQQTMVRPTAYLGLVFLTDEDDCSAAGNDGMFGDKPELAGESASLRCSTRAYTCKATGNLSDGTGSPPAPGYPTTRSYEAAWSDCSARTDSCPDALEGQTGVDASQPTSCSPLNDIKHLADEIKSLKSDPEQILVAGIFGWPIGGDFSGAEPIKFAPRPNPNTNDPAHKTLFDYWSICYDPNHRPGAPGQTIDPETGNDVTAWGWGAGPGLRESAFIDEFGANGMKFSICEADYAQALKQIGTVLERKLEYLCVDYKLWDSQPDIPGLQPDCRVAYRTPITDTSGQVHWTENTQSLPQCPDGAKPETITQDCWQLLHDTNRCTVNGQYINVMRTADEIAAGPLPAGTKVGMQCVTCSDEVSSLAPQSESYKACNY
jgi:hypothetical protein